MRIKPAVTCAIGLSIFTGTVATFAATEGMEQMPVAQGKTTVVTGQENFESEMGFGADEPNVKMMNLMMVEGSGMEGMNMAEMEMAKPSPAPEIKKSGVGNASPFEIKATITPNPPRVGSNQLDIVLIDSKTKKPATGLSLQIQVFMTSMDMGTEEPKAKEIEPGHYRVQVPFAMKGPWAVRIRSQPPGGKDHTRMWENLLNFNAGGSK